jgi:RNA polymerase sigma-70 factor (ECF subfamily)
MYYPKIFGYIFRITGDRELAGDITSETFLKAFIAIGSFKWKGISISSWFFRIATNELNQYFRKQRYTPRAIIDLGLFDTLAGTHLPSREQEDVGGRLERLEEFEWIRRLLQNLPAKYRQPIALRYFEELSIRDIGQILDKKEGTVKSLLSRGLDRLKKMIEDSRAADRPD